MFRFFIVLLQPNWTLVCSFAYQSDRFMIKKIDLRYCLMAFVFLFALTTVGAKTRIMLISDPHVMGPGVLVKKGTAWEDAVYYDRKLTEYSAEIFDELIAIALREKPDLFLITGDLTKDGELVSHQYVAEKLQVLKQAGIKPFVIPGNHDRGTEESMEFDGNNTYDVKVADAKQFAEFYRDFGYGPDAERDENSLSWISEPLPGLVLIGIDTGNDGTPLNGCIKGVTLEWLYNRAMQATRQGKQVIVMMHHSPFPHVVNVEKFNATYAVRLALPMAEGPYYYLDHSYVVDRLAMAGVSVVLSGHVHVTDIAKDANGTLTNTVHDISTASCVSYPNPYRMLTISDDKATMRIQTFYLTELPGRDNFQALSEERMKSGLSHLVWDYTHNEEFCDLFAEIFKVHVMGNEHECPKQQEYLDMYEERLPEMKTDPQLLENLDAYEVTFAELRDMVYSMLEDKNHYGNPDKEGVMDDLNTTIPMNNEGWTAIRTVPQETSEDDQWYTLQGVRIPKPAQKGAYIHDRRLIIKR